MATIIENSKNKKRRTIKLSTADILSIVSEYQKITYGKREYSDVIDMLSERVIYIPEE